MATELRRRPLELEITVLWTPQEELGSGFNFGATVAVDPTPILGRNPFSQLSTNQAQSKCGSPVIEMA